MCLKNNSKLEVQKFQRSYLRAQQSFEKKEGFLCHHFSLALAVNSYFSSETNFVVCLSFVFIFPSNLFESSVINFCCSLKSKAFFRMQAFWKRIYFRMLFGKRGFVIKKYRKSSPFSPRDTFKYTMFFKFCPLLSHHLSVIPRNLFSPSNRYGIFTPLTSDNNNVPCTSYTQCF